MEIRRGFFCSLCSVKNQKFLDTDLKKIIFSYESCEDLIHGSIKTIAFRVNKVMPIFAKMNKHLNCLQKNSADLDDAEFSIDKETYTNINSCFHKFATSGGRTPVYDKCNQLCSEFSLVMPSDIFEGVLKLLVLLKEKIKFFHEN